MGRLGRLQLHSAGPARTLCDLLASRFPVLTSSIPSIPTFPPAPFLFSSLLLISKFEMKEERGRLGMLGRLQRKNENVKQDAGQKSWPAQPNWAEAYPVYPFPFTMA